MIKDLFQDEMEEMSEDLKNPMFTLRLDGFLEVNKLQAKSVLDRTKILLKEMVIYKKCFCLNQVYQQMIKQTLI